MATRTVSVALRSEIGSYVAGMSKAAAATMSVGESAQKSQATASKHFDLAGKSGLLMGGAIVAGMGLAISKSMEFEASMSAVGAATGATTATLGDLRDAAMKAGADTQYSATEAADAITEMAKAGVSAKDILAGGLDGALALAAAGQLDVADAAGIASTAMTQFSLTGKDLPHVADLLAAGAGKAMGSVGDLGAALNQAGLIASAAGLSIEETTAGLSAFASAGLIGSDAGTSFKTMLQAIQAPSGKAAEIMDDLGIKMYDAQGNMLGLADMAGQLQTHMGGLTDEQRNSALATIFGSDAVRAANVLYKEGQSGIADWTAKVNDAGYAQEQAAALTDNLKGDLERLGGSFDTLMIQIGSGSQGPLRGLVQGLTDLLSALGGDQKAFESLPGPVQIVLSTFGGLKDLVGGIVDLFGALPGPVQLAIGAFGLWAVAGDKVSGTFGSVRDKMQAFREEAALQQALFAQQSTDISGADRALGGLGTTLDVTGQKFGLAKAAVSGLAHAIGPELGIAAGVFAVGQIIDGFQLLTGASDDAKAAAEGLADALTLTDEVADRRSIRQAIEDTDGLADALSQAGVSSKDAIDGLLGQEDAQKRVTTALQEFISLRPGGVHNNEATGALMAKHAYDELATGYGTATSNARFFADSAAATTEAMGGVEGAAGGAAAGMDAVGGAADAATVLTEEAQKALDDWIKTLQTVGESFVEPLGVYKGLLDEKNAAERTAAENTAAATESSKDSWKDYVGDVSVSLGEFATQLETQIANQENWRANLVAVSQRGGSEVAGILATMGVAGADITEQMANATGEDFERMKNDLIRDAQLGGTGAAAELDTAMKVMAQVGADGASATARGIADELGLGVDTVAAIAAQYGVTLAAGVNPLLDSLGKTQIKVGVLSNGTRLLGSELWSGGYTGDGGKYEPMGIVHGGEYVLTKEQTSRLGIDRIEAFANQGYANGGYVTAADVPKPSSTAPYGPPISTAGDGTMQAAYAATVDWLNANGGGVAGSGSGMFGTWTSIAGIVQRAIPGARINSTYRPGDPGYHGRNKAVDFGYGSGPGGNGSAGLASIARFLYSGYGKTLAELIYDGAGDNTPDVKNGANHVYNAATRAEHANHVHAAVYHQGTDYVPRTGFAYLEKGEAVIPANLNSREFSGGGGRLGGGSVTVAPPVVKVYLDGQEWRGIARVEAEGVVVDAFTGTTSRGAYNG